MGKVGYQVLKTTNPINKKVGYRAEVSRYTLMEADDVVNYAASNSNIERNVVAAAMAGLTQIIAEYALNGHNVSIEDLGCFTVSNTSEGCDDAGEVNAASVKNVRIFFRPDARLRKEAEKVEFFKRDM